MGMRDLSRKLSPILTNINSYNNIDNVNLIMLGSKSSMFSYNFGDILSPEIVYYEYYSDKNLPYLNRCKISFNNTEINSQVFVYFDIAERDNNSDKIDVELEIIEVELSGTSEFSSDYKVTRSTKDYISIPYKENIELMTPPGSLPYDIENGKFVKLFTNILSSIDLPEYIKVEDDAIYYRHK